MRRLRVRGLLFFKDCLDRHIPVRHHKAVIRYDYIVRLYYPALELIALIRCWSERYRISRLCIFLIRCHGPILRLPYRYLMRRLRVRSLLFFKDRFNRHIPIRHHKAVILVYCHISRHDFPACEFIAFLRRWGECHCFSCLRACRVSRCRSVLRFFNCHLIGRFLFFKHCLDSHISIRHHKVVVLVYCHISRHDFPASEFIAFLRRCRKTHCFSCLRACRVSRCRSVLRFFNCHLIGRFLFFKHCLDGHIPIRHHKAVVLFYCHISRHYFPACELIAFLRRCRKLHRITGCRRLTIGLCCSIAVIIYRYRIEFYCLMVYFYFCYSLTVFFNPNFQYIIKFSGFRLITQVNIEGRCPSGRYFSPRYIPNFKMLCGLILCPLRVLQCNSPVTCICNSNRFEFRSCI